MIKWLKRIGVVGFLFFLVKGLVWLYVIFFIRSCSQQQKEKAGNSSRPSSSISISYTYRG
ncbi:hypothetical protein MUGA111182_09475 [Mucilaginibacter galii]|uniref:hypothetical protein n=1 Tax=Mucilaginibacter galii TaxID=2005073 RepID=UPI0016665AF6|nr:hypothetical protein [Mucilaginibacter galii]